MPVIGSMGAASSKAPSNSQARDPNFNQVALLINSELPFSTNTATTDASTNNVPIQGFATALTVHPSNFSPYNTSWSNQFDGSTGYLNFASFTPTLPTATTPFTMEAWIFPTSFNCVAIASSAYGGSGNIPFVLGLGAGVANAGQGGSTPWFAYYTGATWVGVNSTITLSTSTWYHIAGVFDGVNAKIYVNGVLGGSLTTPWLTGAASTPGFYVGRRWDTAAPAYFPGYISNFRLTIGMALYNANFAPSTVALTAYPVSTLMTCQSNRFLDTSTFANVPTPAGGVTVTGFSPFPETDTTTGSMFFSNSMLYSTSDATSAMVNVQGGEFTLEGWVYIIGMQQSGFWGTTNGGGTQPKVMTWMDSTGHVKFDVVNSTMGYEFTTVNALTVGQWYHIACVRNFNNHYIYINGQRAAVTTTNIGTPLPMIQLSGMTNYFAYGGGLEALGYSNAYISNFRFTASALYNTNFAVPTTPLTVLPFPNKTNILAFQYRQDARNSGACDSSTNKLWFYQAGNPSLGSFSPYSPNGWSVFFGQIATNDRLTYASSSAFDLSGSTWTIEFWLNPTVMPTSQCRVLLFNVNNSLNAFYVALNTDGSMSGSVPYTGTNVVQSAIGAVALNTWTHVALVVNNGTAQFYINGASSGSSITLIRPTSGAVNLYVGYDTAATVNYQYRGYFSNLRINKGLAVYTSNFNVPTSTLPNIAGFTSVLTCHAPQFIDGSVNAVSITPAGAPRTINHTPFPPADNYNLTANSGSIFFEGTGSFYVMQASQAYYFGTSPFTIEMWLYPTAVGPAETFDLWINNSPSFIVGQLQVQFNANQTIQFIYATSTTATASVLTTATIPLYAWTHVAITRISNTITIYFNGVSVQTGGVSQTLGVGNAQGSIGRQTSSGGYYFTGYISNMRVVPGYAMYYGNFIPSTRPLGGLSTNLVTSSENFSPTTLFWAVSSGTLTPNAIPGPLGTTYASLFQEDSTLNQHLIYYSLGVVGVGVTYTFSVYLKAYGPGVRQVSLTYHGGGYPVFDLTTGTIVSNANFTGTPTITPVPNQTGWYRCSVTSTTFMNTGNFYVLPWNTTNNYQGNGVGGFYMWGAQVELGSTMGPYSPTPANTPSMPPALLLSGTTAGVQDQTGKNNAITYGYASNSPITTKSGSGAMTFTTSSDMVAIPYDPTLDTLAGDFTTEFWFYSTSTTQTGMMLTRGGAGNLPYAAYEILVNVGGVQGIWFAAGNGSSYQVGGENSLGYLGSYAVNTWTHLAITRSGNVWRAFINGTQTWTQTVSVILSTPLNRGVSIGAQYADGVSPSSSVTTNFAGSIDEVRITNGIARYTANFIPPQRFLTK